MSDTGTIHVKPVLVTQPRGLHPDDEGSTLRPPAAKASDPILSDPDSASGQSLWEELDKKLGKLDKAVTFKTKDGEWKHGMTKWGPGLFVGDELPDYLQWGSDVKAETGEQALEAFEKDLVKQHGKHPRGDKSLNFLGSDKHKTKALNAFRSIKRALANALDRNEVELNFQRIKQDDGRQAALIVKETQSGKTWAISSWVAD